MVFILLICETLIFHCCFIDVSLMLLWGNIDETAMIWMQTLKIIFFANLWKFDISQLPHWWYFDENLMNNGEFDANNIDQQKLCCANLPNIDVSLVLHWIFVNVVDESSKKFWWDIDVFYPKSDDNMSF